MLIPWPTRTHHSEGTRIHLFGAKSNLLSCLGDTKYKENKRVDSAINRAGYQRQEVIICIEIVRV